MNVLIYLIPMALALGLAGLAAFLWAMRNGQYDDLDGAALRVLTDDDLPSTKPSLDEAIGTSGANRKTHSLQRSIT